MGKGKLLFCHPPPAEEPIDPQNFNRDLYDLEHLPPKRRAALARILDETSTEAGSVAQSSLLDKNFFARGQGGGTMKLPFHHQYSEQGRKQLSGRKLKEVVALEKAIDPAELKTTSKKHFKGNKKKAR